MNWALSKTPTCKSTLLKAKNNPFKKAGVFPALNINTSLSILYALKQIKA